jgi:hypothetical protein
MSRTVLGVAACGLALLLFAAVVFAAAVSVPTDQVALRKSLDAIHRPALTVALALHPDYCSIKGAPVLGWTVECLGVPMHHYTNTTLCRGIDSQRCAPAPEWWTDCVSFWWDIDMWGRPSNPDGTGGTLASMGETCRAKATLAEDRERMRQRGLSAPTVKVFDLTGRGPTTP